MPLVTLKLSVLISLIVTFTSADPSCLDNNGHPVDWFIAIKLPSHEEQPKDKYFFMTSKSTNWSLASCAVDSNCGPISSTVQQVYSMKPGNSDVMVMYNDEPPPNVTHHDVSSSYGHMKGVVAFKTNGNGFWLIHSAPKFSGFYHYHYPETALTYGQHFFCVSFPYSQLKSIANQLYIARPYTYKFSLPEDVAANIPNLKYVAKAHYPRGSSGIQYNDISLTSINGIKLVHFTKSKEFGKDLYGDFVAPSLQTDLFMEGWVHGQHGNVLNSTCDAKFKVFLVQEVQLKNNDWKNTKDHSKWAVSDKGASPWTCLGDINRQVSQFHRGGGTLCFQNKYVWTAFNALVKQYQHC